MVIIVANDDGAAGVGIVGNAGLVFLFDFWSNLCLIFGVTLAELSHNLDPSRVESIHKRSIFGINTTTNR